MYKKLRDAANVLRLADGASIPPDPANADYRDYLRWVAAGNTAQQADPAPARPPKADYGDDIPSDQDERISDAVGLLRGYLALPSPSGAQTVGALKLAIRILFWMLRRQGL